MILPRNEILSLIDADGFVVIAKELARVAEHQQLVQVVLFSSLFKLKQANKPKDLSLAN
jgi:hypothetical protein